jgi:hypothetical protein
MTCIFDRTQNEKQLSELTPSGILKLTQLQITITILDNIDLLEYSKIIILIPRYFLEFKVVIYTVFLLFFIFA